MVNHKGIYIASKIKHAPIWRALRDKGIPIISSWIDEAEPGQTEDFADLWTRCINEASHAGALILYAEEGEVLKGAYIEVGAALASKVPVFLVDSFVNPMTFQHHPLVTRCYVTHRCATCDHTECDHGQITAAGRTTRCLIEGGCQSKCQKYVFDGNPLRQALEAIEGRRNNAR